MITLEKDIALLKYHNTSKVSRKHIEAVSKEKIQIHFSLRATSKLTFNNGGYAIDIAAGNAMLLYNPNQELPINLGISPNGKYIILLVGIDKFHSLFSQEASLIHFFNQKKYYSNKELSPTEVLTLNELFDAKTHSSLDELYLRGKVYELLSLFFHEEDNANAVNCPFLKDENNVLKIQNAKNIIIVRVANPPSLIELANMIDLPLKKLKDGFKQIYGDTVFGFLLNYKMEIAKTLIKEQSMNVSEISDTLGYSTPSHFIAAFKKKYGTTPKKFMMSV